MIRICLLATYLAWFVSISAAQPAPNAGVTVQPQSLVNGTACLFTVRAPGRPDKITAKWMGHELVFTPGTDGNWYALGGVSYETKPGSYDLDLMVSQSSGKLTHIRHPVVVKLAKYKTSRLTVPQKYVTPDAETLKRIEQDKEIKKQVFAHFLPVPEWSGDFIAPVALAISENYGTSRTFNGKLASVHKGTDFRAPAGTPVHASNDGEVVLARELYYEGNCIVIDHGQGFMTMYMHLSKFDVKEGDKVKKDQVIALSGGTGRVTGPHLHMAVRWSGEYLDPVKLLALKLPRTPDAN